VAIFGAAGNIKLKTVEKTLGGRVHAVEKSQDGVKTLLAILITLAGALLIGLAVAILKGAFAPEAASNTASTATVVGANAQPVNPPPTNVVSTNAADTHISGAGAPNILKKPTVVRSAKRWIPVGIPAYLAGNTHLADMRTLTLSQ
jgi:hypothetical protein